MRNNQGLGKCYQPRPSARLITLSGTLIIPDIKKLNVIIAFIIHCFEINNDKYTVARNLYDISLGNHALRAQPTD